MGSQSSDRPWSKIDLKSPDKKNKFLYFKNEKKMIKLLQHQYDITRLYRCLIDVEDNKDLMDNFI